MTYRNHSAGEIERASNELIRKLAEWHRRMDVLGYPPVTTRRHEETTCGTYTTPSTRHCPNPAVHTSGIAT